MNSKKFDFTDRLCVPSKLGTAKQEIAELLQTLAEKNRMEAIRFGTELIEFTAKCVSLIAATPMKGGPRDWFLSLDPAELAKESEVVQ